MDTGLSMFIQHYRDVYLPETDNLHDYYRSSESLEIVIKNAAEARTPKGKHPHQYRLNNDMLSSVAKRLVNKSNEVRRINNFEELLELITTSKVKGFGELAIYDTAFRIGLYLNKLPQQVYLHAGTREGAKYLANVRRKEKIEMMDLPEALGFLEPWQAEDFLCLYKKQIRLLVENKDVELDKMENFCLPQKRGNMIC